jgi:Fe-S-cluster-containing hydrogenase component 2/CRP-like cAMP-binding protein
VADGTVEVRLPTAVAAAVGPGRPAPAPQRLSLQQRIERILGRKGAEHAVQTGGLASDGTILLPDQPIDLRAGERVLLEKGEIFGELSALSRYPVSADVVAASDVTCLMIRTTALRMLFKQKDCADFKRTIDERYRTRTLATHLRHVSLFADLDAAVVERLREKAELLSFEPGASIAQQGTPADAFYLVRGGYVRVGVKVGSAELAVSYLRKGDYAGEIALLLDEPWPFSLYALEHVEIVKIAKAEFDAAIADHLDVQKALWETVVTRLKERGFVTRNPLSAQYLQMAMDTGLIHGESVLLIDLNTCTRCDDCVRACADTHGGTPRFIREGQRYRQWSVTVACYQCTDPVCMIGCPTGAITRPMGTLEVTINKETCIGCHNCVRRCPWGNIIEVPYSSPTVGRDIDLATKCDLCLGRRDGPACVQMCPHGSAVRISFKDLDTVTQTLSR